jgi:WD40 repeat protein
VSRHSVRTLDFEHASIGLAGPKFSFEPRSLTSRYGWIAAGAEHGILAILDGRGEASSLQEGPRKQEVVIGGCLVNGIHIHHNAAGEDVALVSSNDHSLKCYNLSRGYLESPISMPTAMNHASVTPDGKWMVAVGDNTVCYLFAQESGSWVRQGTLSVATDACFATGFSASGRMLAVGSQDGTCSIFDMRMISVTKYPFLHRCHTTRPFPHGSVRALAFSPSPLDLLVFTESTSHATLVDCRDFSAPQQRLSVPLADSVRDRHHGDSHYGVDGRDREISGVCWSRTVCSDLFNLMLTF